MTHNSFLTITVFQENISTRISSKPNPSTQPQKKCFFDGGPDRWKSREPLLSPVRSLPLVWAGTTCHATPRSPWICFPPIDGAEAKERSGVILRAQRLNMDTYKYHQHLSHTTASMASNRLPNPPLNTNSGHHLGWLGGHSEGNNSRPKSLLHSLRVDL